MRTISVQEYMSFNQEQKDLCKKLGIKVQKKTRRTVTKQVTVPKEYTLKMTFTCSLCGSCKTNYYKMIGLRKWDYLKGIKLGYTQSQSHDKQADETVASCMNCIDYLSKLPKTKLITKYIKLFRQTLSNQ